MPQPTPNRISSADQYVLRTAGLDTAAKMPEIAHHAPTSSLPTMGALLHGPRSRLASLLGRDEGQAGYETVVFGPNARQKLTIVGQVLLFCWICLQIVEPQYPTSTHN